MAWRRSEQYAAIESAVKVPRLCGVTPIARVSAAVGVDQVHRGFRLQAEGLRVNLAGPVAGLYNRGFRLLRPAATGRSFNGRTRGSGPRYRGSNPCLPANYLVLAIHVRHFTPSASPKCLQLRATSRGFRAAGSLRRGPPDSGASTAASSRGSDARRAPARLSSVRPASPGASRTDDAGCERPSAPSLAWPRSEHVTTCPAE
jgi:hypothetical protein